MPNLKDLKKGACAPLLNGTNLSDQSYLQTPCVQDEISRDRLLLAMLDVAPSAAIFLISAVSLATYAFAKLTQNPAYSAATAIYSAATAIYGNAGALLMSMVVGFMAISNCDPDPFDRSKFQDCKDMVFKNTRDDVLEYGLGGAAGFIVLALAIKVTPSVINSLQRCKNALFSKRSDALTRENLEAQEAGMAVQHSI